MKPGYKMIIAGLLVYGGFKVKAWMDVMPYKEYAASFVTLLKQQKPFQAQEMLVADLQEQVSIEYLSSVIAEQNLSGSSEIRWHSWQGEEGNYSLNGELYFQNGRTIPVHFLLGGSSERAMRIDAVQIGERSLADKENNQTLFLK